MGEQQNFDELARISEMMISAIEDCNDIELEKLLSEQGVDTAALSQMGRDWTQRAIIAHGKARFAKARQEVDQRALMPRQTVSLDYDAMLTLVQAHIANDPQSPLTLAARNQSGALSVEELQSLVEDINSLKA